MAEDLSHSKNGLACQQAVNGELSAAILDGGRLRLFSGSAVEIMIQVAKSPGARGFYRPIITVTSASNLGGVDHVLSDFRPISSRAFRKESLPSRGKGFIDAKEVKCLWKSYGNKPRI